MVGMPRVDSSNPKKWRLFSGMSFTGPPKFTTEKDFFGADWSPPEFADLEYVDWDVRGRA